MNTTTAQNPCIRCGLERIVKKEWKEKVTNYFGTSIVIHTETVCPDKTCQKILDERFAKERERLETMQIAKEERMKILKKGKKVIKN